MAVTDRGVVAVVQVRIGKFFFPGQKSCILISKVVKSSFSMYLSEKTLFHDRKRLQRVQTWYFVPASRQ